MGTINAAITPMMIFLLISAGTNLLAALSTTSTRLARFVNLIYGLWAVVLVVMLWPLFLWGVV